jgi:hypothetical protein
MADSHAPTHDIFLGGIARKLIARSFPRLKPLQLTISWGTDDGLLCYIAKNGNPLILVHEYLRRATKHVLAGGIAHELCHIDADFRLAPYQRELAWTRYNTLRWCRIREERATDLRVIQLGYGPNLLAFVRFARRLGYTFQREHGLLYAEISSCSRAGGITGSGLTGEQRV